MAPPPRGNRNVVLLGVSLVALGALVYAEAPRHPASTDSASVVISIVPNDGLPLFNGTVTLRPGNATALDALQAAAETANFTVVVTYQYGPAFVVQIDAYRNEGGCGWQYDVNHVWADRSAGEYALATGDIVRWYWGCEG